MQNMNKRRQKSSQKAPSTLPQMSTLVPFSEALGYALVVPFFQD